MFFLDSAASIMHAVMQIDNVSWTIILGEKKESFIMLSSILVFYVKFEVQ